MTLLTNIVEREMFQKLCNMEYRTILKVESVEDNVCYIVFVGISILWISSMSSICHNVAS